ncbi:MAG: hypothetical protein A2251_05350 [Elusimicrobia bacterium RIFOXYA2_FULL_47_53]|nr:MAG: hypothetical protein A2278_01900 [Elusimicrobia bacterium RIFOXYA12_FULL_49_49]OGS10302.1 MAG: hypothetical protein A2386_00575 [Elusimicrobia bacterium RIFOXYB1_FULL_48_9]OGS16801.1 MAG: hypothetical protein A2251_05350 [Elusimicrobia bacterium RIFOXYA2_FULL_47_53]OGS32029.1 MAG: hypothetical protein A2323_08125 [Elusimicrobia bacterium RIFOXYB2_FULL_46_23]
MGKVKILLTGGNGFIARNIKEQLGSEYAIVSKNSSELNLLDPDAVSDCLKDGKFDIVLHSATYDPAPKYSPKDPAKVLENNLRMYFNITRCSGFFRKLIYFGSGAEFCRENWAPKMKESYFDTHVPKDQYGYSKYLMTKYALSNKNIYNLRVFSVFGKYEDWKYRFISRACCCSLAGKDVNVSQNVVFDYLYIDDFIRVLSWFIENTPKHSVYNVCSGTTCDYTEIVNAISGISGKPLKLVTRESGLRKEYSGDNSLLLGELPGFTFMPLKESIKNLYVYYESNKNIIDTNEL